jgi:Family of unknown function (DUF5681)
MTRKTQENPEMPRPFYEVGYGKPPKHRQFRKGQSGNPGGRPRGVTALRAKALALEEAYRMVTVQDGDDAVALPAIQAIMRSQIAAAAKGNGPSQRAVIAAVREIEHQVDQEIAKRDAALEAARKQAAGSGSYIEAARRIAFLLHLADREQEQRDAAATNAAAAAPPARDGAPQAPRLISKAKSDGAGSDGAGSDGAAG